MRTIELDASKEYPTVPATARMKGSAIRSHNIVKPIHPIHSELLTTYPSLAIIQQKKNRQPYGATAQNRDSLELTPLKKQVKQQHILAKTISAIVDNQRRYACLTARATTPTMAKQFSQTPTKNEGKNSQKKSKVIKTDDRYMYFDTEDQAQNRLCLSTFQQKVKSSASTSKKRPNKTEQQLINLKLQGTNYKTTTKCTHSDEKATKTLDRSEQFEKNSHIYLTQQKNYVAKILNQVINEAPYVQDLRQIMSKIHIEAQKQTIQQSQSKPLKIRHRKMTAYSAQPSQSRKAIKNAETARQHVRVNVINIIEEKQMPTKRTCHQVYTKYFKKPEQLQLQPQRQPKALKHQQYIKIELIQELRQIQRQIKQHGSSIKKMPICQDKKQKYRTNQTEQKLKKRKSLIEHYTFKKVVSQKMKPLGLVSQEFQVEGWQMMSPKQMINM